MRAVPKGGEQHNMTVGEVKQKALKIIDEYSGAAVPNPDTALRIADLCDMGQKQLAQIVRVVKDYPLPEQEERRFPMPADFYAVRRVWQNEQPARNIGRWFGNTLVLHSGISPAGVTVEYFALPKTVDVDTPDSTELSIAQDAQECLPYFVAWQLLLGDPSADVRAVAELYDRSVAALCTRLPGSAVVRKCR